MLQKTIASSPFARNILTLMTGSGAAALIPILASPLLSRLYSPEDFGLLSLYLAAVSICATFSTLRYEPAIMLPENENDAESLLFLSIGIAIGISVILYTVITLLGADVIFSLIGFPQLTEIYNAIALSSLSLAIFQTLSFFLNRNKRYKSLSCVKLFNTCIKAGLSIALAKKIQHGLIYSNTISFAVFAIVFFILAKKNIKHKPSLKNIIAISKKYKDFPKFNILSDTINTFTANMHIILLFTLFGNDFAGTVSFASKLILLPLTIVSTSFSQVFYQKISTTHTQNSLLNIYKKSLLGLASFAVLLILGSLVVPKSLIIFFFGSQWGALHNYLIPITCWCAVHFCGSSLSTIYTRLRMLRFLFVFNVANAIFTAVSIYLCHYFGKDELFTITTFSLGRVFLYGFISFYGILCIKRELD